MERKRAERQACQTKTKLTLMSIFGYETGMALPLHSQCNSQKTLPKVTHIQKTFL